MPAIEPTAAQLERLGSSAHSGPVVMLNLLRFREQAEGESGGGSGAEAYARYGAAVTAHLERVGARVLLAAAAEECVIGPEEGEWDLVLAVEYPSRGAFLEMISDPDYLKIHEHRAAALADSRLIACQAMPAAAE